MKPLKLLLGIGLVLMSSCTDNIPGMKRDLSLSGNVLSIPFQVENEMPLSRSESAAIHERTVKNAYIMFFNSEDNMIAYRTIGIPSGSANLSFDVPETVQQGTDYNILVIGNAEKYLSYGYTTVNTYLDTFIGKSRNNVMTAIAATIDDPVTRKYPGVLPFYGKYVDKEGNEIPFNYTRNEVGFTVNGEFWFSRAICRIDINNLVPGLLDIKYAKVCNYRNESLYFKDGTTVGRVIPLERASDDPAGDWSDGYMPTTDVAGESGNVMSQRLRESLYALPNAVNTTVQNDKATTCLIIAGYYTENGKKDSELTYYRFNLANPGEAQLMNRNFVYRAVIKGVKRRGHKTDFDAYNDGNPIFEYDVDDEWDADDDNFVTDGKGNFLIVSKSHLTFQGSADEADKVELRISTSPELKWSIEWDDSQPDNDNQYFTCEKLTDQAIKVGPREVNDSPYVRYGYIYIKAENEEKGVNLKLRIYLQQLSLLYNVKTLTVNGATGSYKQELDPMGGSVFLKVVTGNNSNPWNATDEGDRFMNWDTQGLFFTEHGNNNTTIEIRVPANTTGIARTATIVVALDNPDEKVKPVRIELTQEPSPQLMDIINFPSSGEITLECLDLTEGNPNGVAQYRSFPVRLTDPAHYRYEVTSNFDRDIDLVLSYKENVGPMSLHPVYADQSAGHRHDDKLTDCEHGNAFYINAFRTGPGDPEIVGTITIKAYNPEDETAPTEERSFTVKIHSEKCSVNDVVILNGGITQPAEGETVGQPYNLLLADRNLSVVPRVQPGSDEINIARFYSTDDFFQITGLTGGAADPTQTVSYLGRVQNNTYGTKVSTAINSYTTDIKVGECPQLFWNDNQHVNSFYSENVWKCPTVDEWKKIIQKIRFTKCRPFIISDLNDKSSGKELPVACWLPYRKVEQINLAHMPSVKEDACGYACDPLLVGSPHLAFLNYRPDGTCVSQVYSPKQSISGAKAYLLLRLCRHLSIDETEKYKTEILKY